MSYQKIFTPNERTMYLAPEVIRKIHNGKTLGSALMSLDLSMAAFRNWCKYTGNKCPVYEHKKANRWRGVV